MSNILQKATLGFGVGGTLGYFSQGGGGALLGATIGTVIAYRFSRDERLTDPENYQNVVEIIKTTAISAVVYSISIPVVEAVCIYNPNVLCYTSFLTEKLIGLTVLGVLAYSCCQIAMSWQEQTSL